MLRREGGGGGIQERGRGVRGGRSGEGDEVRGVRGWKVKEGREVVEEGWNWREWRVKRGGGRIGSEERD